MNHHVETDSPGESCANRTVENHAANSSSTLLKNFVERRDQQAFAELVRLHGPLVYGVCRRVVGNHHDAQDAFQATFLVLSQRAASIKNREVFRSWLYRVAFQISMRARAKLKRRRIKELSMDDVHELASAESGIWSELEAILDQELNRLADKYRIPILLCDLGGSTQKEAALELGWSEGTLSTRLTKARTILAERLSRHGFVLSAGTLILLLAESTASAAPPASWVAATLQTTNALTTGAISPVGASSSNIATLAQEAMKPMNLSNLNFAAALVTIVALGLGLQLQQADQAQQPEQAVTTGVSLPAAVLRDLEESARQLNPISVSYTKQLKSSLPEQETWDRLNLATDLNRDFYFDEFVHRVIWQANKFYTFKQFPVVGPLPVEKRSERGYQVNENCFDGRTLCEGQILKDGNEGVLAKDTEASYSRRNAHRTVRDSFSSPYFTQFSGLSFPTGKERAVELRAESELLGALRQGGKLISVENVVLDERPHVKVALTVENAARTLADKMDVEAMKKGFERMRGTQDQSKLAIDRVLLARNLPPTKRMVYYLDPERRHAIRRSEEWYEPDQLVLRCDRSDFEQVSDRQLWLPRRCEVEHHVFPSAPGIVLEESFLTEVIIVTEISVAPVPDEQFVLNSTNPGILIYDETGLEPGTQPDKPSPPQAPYMTGATPEETLRNKTAAQKQAQLEQGGATGNEMAPKPKGTSIVRWLLIVNGAAVLLIGIFVGYRRLAKS